MRAGTDYGFIQVLDRKKNRMYRFVFYFRLLMVERSVLETNQSESHSGLQQLRFTRNYMVAWRT